MYSKYDLNFLKPDGHGTVKFYLKSKLYNFNKDFGETGILTWQFQGEADVIKVTLIDSLTNKTLDSFDFKFIPYDETEICDYTNQITES